MQLLLGAVCAYLLGSIPFALVLARWLAGVDIRTIGSGNVGATNAARAFSGNKIKSRAMFLAVYVLDFCKGFWPAWFGWDHLGATGSSPQAASVLLGASAILGHCTSPFLGFRGGKGVATTTGVFAWLQPLVLMVALVVFFVVRLATGHVFLGSLAIGIVLAGGTILVEPATAFGGRWPVTALALVLAGFLFFTHRSNIRQMLTGRKAAA